VDGPHTPSRKIRFSCRRGGAPLQKKVCLPKKGGMGVGGGLQGVSEGDRHNGKKNWPPIYHVRPRWPRMLSHRFTCRAEKAGKKRFEI